MLPMVRQQVITGYFQNQLPYVRIGSSQRNLVIFQGLEFNHKPPSGQKLRMSTGRVKLLAREYTVYMVSRKPNLPSGYSLRDMSNDYANMIRGELGGPVDIMGISTGGPIAQYFAVDHAELVRHLVLAMTGYRLTDGGRQLQRQLINLAEQERWRATAACLARGINTGASGLLLKVIFWIFGKRLFGSPTTPNDGIVELKAEEGHDFKKQLADIHAPTLVIGGDKDFFYPIRETADGIPKAKLILYKGVGHSAIMRRRFQEDVLSFLNT